MSAGSCEQALDRRSLVRRTCVKMADEGQQENAAPAAQALRPPLLKKRPAFRPPAFVNGAGPPAGAGSPAKKPALGTGAAPKPAAPAAARPAAAVLPRPAAAAAGPAKAANKGEARYFTVRCAGGC